jgi:carbon monoxide dehydrogenase subunit G
MTTATRSIHIDVAPETVFDRIVDPTTVPPGITIQTVNESSDGVGNVYEWTYRLAGIPLHGITVYSQYVPNRRFACKNLGMVAATVVFTVEPEDGGTRSG